VTGTEAVTTEGPLPGLAAVVERRKTAPQRVLSAAGYLAAPTLVKLLENLSRQA